VAPFCVSYQAHNGLQNSAAQTAYIAAEEEVKDGTVAHNDVRNSVYDLVDRDDVSYVSAGHTLAHFEWSVFTYNQVFSLYQFSENLETWCRRV